MKENKYDENVFFDKYSQMERSKKGLEGAGEWKTLKEMLPDFTGKKVLDLGCGYGSVSYTHLDVYKRQVYHGAERLYPAGEHPVLSRAGHPAAGHLSGHHGQQRKRLYAYPLVAGSGAEYRDCSVNSADFPDWRLAAGQAGSEAETRNKITKNEEIEMKEKRYCACLLYTSRCV